MGRAGVAPRWALAIVALVGAAIGAIPAMASSEAAPTVKAVETSLYTYAWSPAEAAVSSGGQVAFSNSTAGVPHGIVWTSTAKPSCDASVPDGEAGKEVSSSSSWSGNCTFAAAGAYTFHCSVHPYMTGTITVSGPTTTETTPTGTTTTGGGGQTTTTTSTPEPPSAGASPLAGTVSKALHLPKTQRGGWVRGSIALSSAGAGGRIAIDVFAPRASLAKSALASPGRSRSVRVGHLARSSLHAGELRFALHLDAPARAALRRHRRLALQVKIAITPSSGHSLQIARSIVERV